MTRNKVLMAPKRGNEFGSGFGVTAEGENLVSLTNTMIAVGCHHIWCDI